MKIILNEREIDTLTRAIEFLEKYSAMYSAMIKNEPGNNFDTAGTAAGMLKTIIKEGANNEK